MIISGLFEADNSILSLFNLSFLKFLFPCNHGFIYIDTNSTATISNIYAYKNSLFKVFLRYFFSNYFNQNTDQNIRYKLTADSKFPESINMVACAHKVNFSIKENPKGILSGTYHKLNNCNELIESGTATLIYLQKEI